MITIMVLISRLKHFLIVLGLSAVFFSTASAAPTAGRLPFEFTYDGRIYRGFEGVVDGTLKVSVIRACNPDFDENEYTVWFENISDRPSAILEDVYAIKTSFKGSAPLLRGCMGDHENFYSQYCHDLKKEKEISFTSASGRATHVVFPYFDLVHGNGGTRIALGWAGTWKASFTTKGAVTAVAAKTNPDLRTVLLPGEKIRTGLVVMLDYDGRSEYGSVNKWRRWFMEHNLPKADSSGRALSPISTFCFAGDTGLPNSDGSISETYFTWQRTLAVLRQEKLLPDFRWFDAGWYADPSGNTVASDWWGTVGAWEPDPVKWPDGTLKESNDACHALGVKVLTWFEPERVTHLEQLCRNYGYKHEWGVVVKGKRKDKITSNLGNPECLEWTLKRIITMMEENSVDMYREDNNSNPAGAWKILDARDESALGLPRTGINENKCIQGHYALWDGILEYCRRSGKCTFLDSCASGGGRNDIESMRRGIPMMRSDYDRTTCPMRLQQSAGFNKWIPFHGSSTKETAGQLDNPGVPDIYTVRASLLPVWNEVGAYSHNPDLNFNSLRANRAVWQENSHLLVKDFYELSSWHDRTDTSLWTVFAYSDPETGESIVLGFRQETCEMAQYTVKLPFVSPEEKYIVKDDDSGTERVLEGKVLSKGITLELPSPRSSLLWHITLYRQ